MGTGRSKIEGLFQKSKKTESPGCNLDENLEAQNNNQVRNSRHEIIEMLEVNQNSVNSVTLLCDSKDEFLQYFESDIINELSAVLFVRVEFSCALPELDATDLQRLTALCHAKPLVLLLVSKTEKNWSILWKSEKIEEFLKLQHLRKLTWDENLIISEHVADFLAKSLQSNHLGLTNKIQFQHGLKPVDIDFIADSREFNLLLLATEQGNVKIVKILLKLEMNLTSNDGNMNAQSLAMDCKQFDVLHAFLQNNYKFPISFDGQNCTGKFKDFCDVTEEVHKLIKSNETEKLAEILDQHGHLCHFYDFSNKSALIVAIESEAYDVFDLLLSKKFRFGSHENPAELYDQLDTKSKRIIREIQNKYSQQFLEKHIHTLTANSTACFDETEAKDKYDKVLRAFELLSLNPFVKIILKIVAASKNFKIVFDFNRDAVNILDPTTTESTQGIFYFSGRIFIGAKQLLSSLTEHETLAVLIHELCHFAMNLVYQNKAKPYKSNDQKTMKEFEEISMLCEELSDREEVIGSVYDCYPEEAFHAELIVRVVHLMVLYRNEPEKMTEIRATFIQLFEFYEKKIVPELEQALPEIEGREEKELKKKDRKISKLIKVAIIGGILSVVGIVAAIVFGVVAANVVGNVLYTPTYKFGKMSVVNQMSVIKAPINYKNTSLEFCNLFPENSTIYDQLTFDHIFQMLDGVPLDFNDPHLHYLEEQVSHKWENLTEKLKQKFLTSNFTFQNESLKFEDLHDLTPVAFNSLKSDQIIKVLDGKELVVHKMIKNETKFYVERKIFDENIYVIYFIFLNFLNGNKFSPIYEFLNNTDSNETFDDFYCKFVSQNFETQFEKLDKVKNSYTFSRRLQSQFKIISKVHRENSGVDKKTFEVTDILFPHKLLQIDFDQILNIANESKMFIWPDEARTGKTVTFEQFTMRIKKKFPTQWVSYVDLKDHKNFYKKIQTIQDVKNMLATIFELSSDNEFELRVFEDLFDSGNVILLWNGFDEISPEFSDDVMRILRLIRNETQNIQFVCTRLICIKILRDKFMVRTHTLVPLNKEGQNNFVEKFFKSKIIEPVKIQNYVEKVQKIINSTESTEDFDTPLMLGMFAELVENDVEIRKSENLYQIYEKFVNKKIEIWKVKSEFGSKFLSSLGSKNSGFNMMNLYQLFALKNELNYRKIWISKTSNLKIMHLKVPEELTSEEISRMGILYINGPKSVKFAHKTFSEFFSAKFIVDKIYNENDEVSEKEAENRVYVFLRLFNLEGVQKFIKSYLESKALNKQKSFNLGIIKKFIEMKKSIYDYIDYQNYDHILWIKFFQDDPNSLKIILLIDEDETVYTRLFRYVDHEEVDSYSNLIKIKEILKPLLSDEEMTKFISGKNQKGIILFSSYLNRKIPKHDLYFLNETLLNNSDAFYVFETIAKTLTIDEIKALLEIEEIWGYRLDKMYWCTPFNRLTFDEKMWNLIEKNTTKSEQKEIIFSIFKSITLWESATSLNYKLNISNHLLSNDEIFYLFKVSNILSKMIWETENLKILWEFFAKHTIKSQQKEFLKGNRTRDILFDSIKYQQSFMNEVYESFFEPTEIKDIFFSTDFLEYFDIYFIDKLIKYLEKLALKTCSGPCFEEVYKRKAELEEEEEEEEEEEKDEYF